MTAAFFDQWSAELVALEIAGLPRHIPSLVPVSRKAAHLMSSTSNNEGADKALLTMKQEAWAQGVHCSFGAKGPNPLGLPQS
jgi:hypothetical protein